MAKSNASNARALLLSQLIRLAVTTLSVTVLSRLLTPADFGVMALVTSVMGIAGILGDLGLSLTALREPALSQKQWTGLWWVNAVFGLLLTLTVALIALISPFTTWVFNDTTVPRFLLAVAPVFFINGCSVQYRVQLGRDKRFGTLGLIEAIAPLIGFAVALPIALANPTPWALVAQQLAGPIALLIISVSVVRRLPGMYRRHPGIRHIVYGGGAVSGGQVIKSIALNLGPLALGRFVGEATIGAFSRATTLVGMPQTNIGIALNRMTVPVFAEGYRQGDLPRQVRKTMANYGYTIGLLTAFIGGFAPAVVFLALGDQWLAETPNIMAVLAFGTIFQSAYYVLIWALIGAGMAKTYLRIELVTRCISILGVLLAAPHGALIAAAVYSGSVILASIGYIIFALPKLNILRSTFLAHTIPNILCLVTIFIAGQVISRYIGHEQSHIVASIIQLLVGMLVSGTILGIFALLSKPTRNDIKDTIQAVSKVTGLQKLVNRKKVA